MSYKWYNNGIKTVKVREGEEIPTGFVPGRLKTGRPAWNKGLTKHTDLRVASYSNPEKNKGKTPWNKGLTKQDSESLQVVSNKLSAFRKANPRTAWNKGLEMPAESRAKISKANKGRTAWNKGLTKETSTSVLSTSIHLMNHPYNLTPEQIAVAKEKEYATKRRNKSFNTSKPADNLYRSLVSLYGESDVLRQYCDKERYPFACDFYVKSLDLFIEYNGTFEHGDHPYDPHNEKDVEELLKIKQKAQTKKLPNRYDAWYTVWTQRDPLKLKTFRDNHLNFQIIYKNNLILTE